MKTILTHRTTSYQPHGPAFFELVEQNRCNLQHTAFSILGDQDWAEDIVQDALLLAWNHLETLRDIGALKAWVTRIVTNQAISSKRRFARSLLHLRQTQAEYLANALAAASDEQKGLRERDWDLAEAIDALPEKQRVAIILHYYKNYTLTEMADVLHTSENTLKKRLQAALFKLRTLLHPADFLCASFSLREGSPQSI